MEKKNQTPTEQQIKERKLHWIGHTLHKPHGAVERHALDWNTRGSRMSGRQRKPGKEQENGTAEGRRKLERSKTTCFGQNQMEDLQEGPMFHRGTKGVNDNEATYKI